MSVLLLARTKGDDLSVRALAVWRRERSVETDGHRWAIRERGAERDGHRGDSLQQLAPAVAHQMGQDKGCTLQLRPAAAARLHEAQTNTGTDELLHLQALFVFHLHTFALIEV